MSDERRRVLVTGISRGVGAALARTLARRSGVDGVDATGPCDLFGVYHRSHTQAQALAREVEASGQVPGAACSLHLLQADLGDAGQLASMLEQLASGGPLDAVVLNAGISIRAPFETREVEGLDPIRASLRMNLEAPLLLLRDLLRSPGLSDGASVVLVSSNLARHGLVNKVAYCAAKAGLEGATRALAKELGARGIRVNAVAPGVLRTDMTADFGEAGYAAYASEVPLGRVGSAEEAAKAIAFLLSDDASYVSGQIIDVDGGWGA